MYLKKVVFVGNRNSFYGQYEAVVWDGLGQLQIKYVVLDNISETRTV
jgi:hypothetical protein